MSTTSNDLVGGTRPGRCLLDLPKEITDQIFGYLVYDKYLILPASTHCKPCMQSRRDFRHLSIRLASKHVNREVMEVLQRKSWFTYDMTQQSIHCSLVQRVPTHHMMNVELMVGEDCGYSDIAPIFESFAGASVLRRTCRILIHNYSKVLMSDYPHDKGFHGSFGKFFLMIASLTGFLTVVLHNPSLRMDSARDKDDEVHDRYDTKMSRYLKGCFVPGLGLTLGPAMPGDPAWVQQYGPSFEFHPRLFQARLGVKDKEHEEGTLEELANFFRKVHVGGVGGHPWWEHASYCLDNR